VGDTAAEALAALPALTQLALSGTSVGEAGARALARDRLRALELHDSAGVLAGAARALAGLAGSLVALDLTLARRAPPRRPPEARARPAASQSRLLSARRAAAQLGGAGLLALAPLTRLTALTAGQTKVRDGALPMLRGLPALQLLNLASNDITDAGAAGPGARAGAPRSEPGAP